MIVTETKPSGLVLRYSSSSPRGYWLRDPGDRLPGTTFEDLFAEADPAIPREKGQERWFKAISVTTVLKCLDKPALPWWGMRVGAENCLELQRRGLVRLHEDGKITTAIDDWVETRTKKSRKKDVPNVEEPIKDWSTATPEERVVKLLTLEKLTVNHVKAAAGVRGQTAHDAFETFCETGILPYPPAYPPEEYPYLVGLRKFLRDAELEGGTGEVMVGSWEHMFAGRYDRRTRMRGEVVCELVRDKDTLEVVERRTERWNGEFALLDVKTGKWVYETHPLQLEAYEGASVDNGYEPTEARAVVHLTWDGEYEVRRSEATFQDFLAVLEVSKIMKRLSR